MDYPLCSILTAAEGEPIDGTAPEKDSAIFLPTEKTIWHRSSAKEILKGISVNSDLNRAVTSLRNPLIAHYAPNELSDQYIYVADSSGGTGLVRLMMDIAIEHKEAL